MKRIPLLLASLLLPALSQAGDIQPGLWEISVKMNFLQGGPQMSAEERAQMKALGIDPLGEMKDQRCISAEQAAQEFDPSKMNPDENGGCSTRNMKRSGNQMSGEYVCNGNIRGQGKVQVTLSATSFKGYNTLAGTSNDPQLGEGPVQLRSDFSGRRLGADCAAIKQAGRPAMPAMPQLPAGMQLPPGVQLPPGMQPPTR